MVAPRSEDKTIREKPSTRFARITWKRVAKRSQTRSALRRRRARSSATPSSQQFGVGPRMVLKAISSLAMLPRATRFSLANVSESRRSAAQLTASSNSDSQRVFRRSLNSPIGSGPALQ